MLDNAASGPRRQSANAPRPCRLTSPVTGGSLRNSTACRESAQDHLFAGARLLGIRLTHHEE